MGSIQQDIKDTVLGLYETVSEKWNDFTQFLAEGWPLLVVLFLGLGIFWWYADPPPPRHVIMATGSPGGTYAELGKKYAAFFAKRGITLELVATKGAEENVARLSDRHDPVQAAFVQSGVVHPSQLVGIQSLGAIAYDPIWFFYRGPEVQARDFEELRVELQHFQGTTLSVGVKGSGTYAQAMHILELTGLNKGHRMVNLPGEAAVAALQRGQIDGIFIVDGYESPNVQALLNDPTLHLAKFTRADAFARLLPFLHILNVPAGGFSLVRNFPSEDIKLLATTTHLLIDERMHPAIQFLFLEAAKEINGKSGFFAKRGEFPSFKDSGFVESPVALHFEKNGSPWLMSYLPFWLAELVNRLAFILLPFCVVAYPVLMALPGYRNKRMRRRIDRIYGSLKQFERELIDVGYDPLLRDSYLKRIDLLEYQALQLKVSRSMSGDYYSLRSSIDYVRNCLSRGVHPYQVDPELVNAPDASAV